MVAGWMFSESLDQIAPALVKAQSGLEPIRKEHTAEAGRARYSYAKIEDVVRQTLPILNRAGLFVSQSQDPDVSPDVVIYTLLLHTSGQYAMTACRVPTDRQSGPQGAGSAHTYARRYALLAALGIAAEDDDGRPPMRQKESWSERAAEQMTISEIEQLREQLRKLWFSKLNGLGFARLPDPERHELQRRLFKAPSLADIPSDQLSERLESLRSCDDEALKAWLRKTLTEIRG